MALKPDGRDLRIIAFHLGRVATGLALVIAIPAVVALALGEWNAASALWTGTGLAVILGRVSEARLRTRAPLTWAQGTVVVALAWLIGPLLLGVLMLAGTLSFALHYALWRGDGGQPFRNLEVRALAISGGLLSLVVLAGLGAAGTQTTIGGLTRKGAFTLFSAHSGTGFAVTNGATYLSDGGVLAPAAIVTAMAFGGMAGSTAGGIKAIRQGLTVKGVVQDVRRLLLPESAVVVATYHARRRRILQDRTLRAATTLLLLDVATYLAGAGVGLLYGRWEITATLFESVSAAANVGLSVGIVDPSMPTGLQLTYLLQMWLGRLEFTAAFALLGYAVALPRWRG